MTADMLQTNDIYDRGEDGYYEVNPVIAWGVESVGKGFVPLYFASSFYLRYQIADWFPQYRAKFLGTTAMVSGSLVVHNQDIGLGLNFGF